MSGENPRTPVMILQRHDGFALPSVLMLVTLLAVTGFSVISLLYLNTQVTLLDVARAKSEYASESGVVHVLDDLNATNEQRGTKHVTFDDGSSATASWEPYGLFVLVQSKGEFRHLASIRYALAAQRPERIYDNALVFGNPNHQLVLTGSIAIKGDIQTGPAGVSIGTLRDRSTPRSLPIEGNIVKQPKTGMPALRRKELLEGINQLGDLLNRGSSGSNDAGDAAVITLNAGATISNRTVGANVSTVFINGDAQFGDTLVRRGPPLTIVVTGKASIKEGTSLIGLIKIVAANDIIILSHSVCTNAIVFSKTAIEVSENVTAIAQLIAPSITVRQSACLQYPSALLSMPSSDVKNHGQALALESGVKIEGIVASLGDGQPAVAADKSSSDASLVVMPGAEITGTIYSENKLTMDGSVKGSVATKDFFFYEAPTSYYGWLRMGSIDRLALPKAYLIPAAFSEHSQFDVLEWL